MRAAEVLRKLADKLDQVENSAADVLEPNKAEPCDTDEKFMAPNQQKLELLKKGVGVESEFDEDADEVEDIRKNAGVIHVASDDDPLE
jgi:hypothetical protein